MTTVQGMSGVGYIASLACPNLNSPEKVKYETDTYTPGGIEGFQSNEYQSGNIQITQEQAKTLSQKYNLHNLDRNQYSKLLMELRDSGIITEQEYSIAYAGTMIHEKGKAPAFPYGKEKIDFVQFLDTCSDYCRDKCDSTKPDTAVLFSTYTKLSKLFRSIDQAQQSHVGETNSLDQNVTLLDCYSDRVIQLYEQLKSEKGWLNKNWGLARLGSEYNVTARELAKELLLSDSDLLESLAKELWIWRAKNNQQYITDNKPEAVGRLPKDYQEIVDNIKQILNGTAPDKMDLFGEFLVPNSKVQSYNSPINFVYSSLDSLLQHKAEKQPLTDVERVLSRTAAQVEKNIWQNFDGQMKDIQDKINSQFGQSGFSLDINKEYQFYLNPDFTISVRGGTDDENKNIADVINSHPKESYKFDPLHEILMAIYFSRPDDFSIAPWRSGTISDELIQKYGFSTNIPGSYVRKMSQFLSAYEWNEMDLIMKQNWGFGVNDIYLDNGKIIGKSDVIQGLIDKMEKKSLEDMTIAFAEAKSKYTGTPRFFEPVFVFKNGKFQLTYEKSV